MVILVAMTTDQLAVVRSYVGEVVTDADLQARHDRLQNIDSVVVETLRARLAVLANDEPGTVVVDGITISQGENMRQVEKALRDFIAGTGTGLETGDSIVGSSIGEQVRAGRDSR